MNSFDKRQHTTEQPLWSCWVVLKKLQFEFDSEEWMTQMMQQPIPVFDFIYHQLKTDPVLYVASIYPFPSQCFVRTSTRKLPEAPHSD